jgi:hypothetical protein
MTELQTEEVTKPKRKKRQVRRKGNNRVWAKWTVRQNIGRTFRAMKVPRPKLPVRAILGYDHIEFMEHIERSFSDGMCWELIDEIHIDHVIPLRWFIVNKIHRPEVINDLSNLMPIWAKDNLKKSTALPDNFEELRDRLLTKYNGECHE